jgi:hypothetical protein
MQEKDLVVTMFTENGKIGIFAADNLLRIMPLIRQTIAGQH